MKKLLKSLYHIIPFKLELFSLLKKIWLPNISIFQHLHFIGVFNVDIAEDRRFKIKHYGFKIENEIFWSGLTNGREKESIKLWIKLCENATSIIDIGANTGIYSLMAKAINPVAKVYAFEPVSRVFDKLKENIVLNYYDIVALEEAVSNFDGEASIFDNSAEHIYSVTVNKNMFSPETKVVETKIKTVTMDSFINQYRVKNIDLMKIDVETHEPEVLEGFSKYISVFKPTMLIEILDDQVGARVFNLVKDLGYLYFNIDEKGGIRQMDYITKSDFFNYLLCNREVAERIGLMKNN